MDETFSSIDLVTQCLLDKKRTEKFAKAIEKVVTPESVVLDVGTGSGILAMFAARSGAKKVYSIEIDPFVAQLASENVHRNGYDDKIKVMLGDARNINLPEGTVIDILTMELLTTGMIDEFQIWAINTLHSKGYISEKTKCIPYKHDTFVSLTQTDFNDYGLNMRMVKHFWSTLPKPKIKYLSRTELLNSVTFEKINKMEHSSKQIITATKSGVINSIYLTSVTWLDKNISLGETLALNGPVCVPTDSDIEVKKGDQIELSIDYQFGNGFRNFRVIANKL